MAPIKRSCRQRPFGVEIKIVHDHARHWTDPIYLTGGQHENKKMNHKTI
jgi:hypothetical protein